MKPEGPRNGRSAHDLYLLVAAVAVGVFLRLDQVFLQIVADDEWHAITAARDRTFLDIVTHFGQGDYSIPLALYDKVLLLAGSLCEISLRSPMLGAGILTLITLPLALRRFGTTEAGLFAALLAISPLHVYFSRYARPYGIALLLVWLSLLTLSRGLEKGGRGRLAGAAVAGSLACWFLPVVAPFLATGGLVLGGMAFRSSEREARRRFLLFALVFIAVTAALLGPPALVDLETLTAKSGRSSAGLDTGFDAASLFLGLTGPVRLAIAGGLTLIGLVRLARRSSLIRVLLVAGLVQVLVVLASGADQLQAGIVLARYCLPVLPLLLLGQASGFVAVLRLLRAPHWLRSRIAWIYPVVLVLAGPLPGIHTSPNAFIHHATYQYSYAQWETRRPKIFEPRYRRRMSPFYFDLHEQTERRGPVLEAPWSFEWQNNVHYAYYQRLHGGRVWIGRVKRPGEEGLILANFLDPSDVEAVSSRGIRYAIFHEDASQELRNPNLLEPVDVAPWVALYRARFGEPIHEDRFLTVFELTRETDEE